MSEANTSLDPVAPGNVPGAPVMNTAPPLGLFAGRAGLWLILLLALAVRLPVALFERPADHTSIEIASLAQSLRAGQGFFLDVRGLWFLEAPAVHYGGYDQSVMTPMLLSLLLRVAPLGVAERLLGPLMFLAGLGLIMRALRRQIGPGVAGAAGLLLAVQPALFSASLEPGAAMAFFALGLILWAHAGARSAQLSGLACAIAFLTHPLLGLALPLLGLTYLRQAVSRREAGVFARFAIFAALGPVWQMNVNHAAGAPLLLLPGLAHFRLAATMAEAGYAHRADLYAGPLETLRAQGPAIARLIVANFIQAIKILFSTAGLALLTPLVPAACAGVTRDRSLRPLAGIGALGGSTLLTGILAWPIPAEQNLGIVLVVTGGLILVIAGAYEILDREPLRRTAGAWTSLATWATLAVALVWLGVDGAQAGRAALDGLRGRPSRAERHAASLAPLAQRLASEPMAAAPLLRRPVIATNEPWLLRRSTGLPATILPCDLTAGEWLRYLDTQHAEFLVLDLGTWPTTHDQPLSDLVGALTRAGWQPWGGAGDFNAWRRPAAGPTTPSKQSDPAPTDPAKQKTGRLT